MILFKKTGDLNRYLDQQRSSGATIGFVPTLGALHEGHISLIDISKKNTTLTVCSIFVNPTQFNDPKDYQKYPITIEKDIILLENARVDVLFLPELDEVYPGGTKDLETYDLGVLETMLEGKYRPGHFQGVCQVMRRLLQLVKPDDLFMGQKDYQQCMIVKRLIHLMGWTINFHTCPIIREADGLAMSSRNVRLNPDERRRATAIYKALLSIANATSLDTTHLHTESPATTSSDTKSPATTSSNAPSPNTAPSTAASANTILAHARQLLEEAQFRVDYVVIADAKTLEPVERGTKGAVALIAAFQGEVRLIDNMILP